jgi:hypothetical protein
MLGHEASCRLASCAAAADNLQAIAVSSVSVRWCCEIGPLKVT